MKNILFFLLFINSVTIFAQKHDYNYYHKIIPSESGAYIGYQDSIQDIVLDYFTWEGTVSRSPTLSDKEGHFLGYTNNRHVYDSLGRIAINGDSIAVGFFQTLVMEIFPEHQGVGVGNNGAFIPISDSLFYLFHASSEVWTGSPEWAIDIEEMGQGLTSYADGLYLTKVYLNEDGRLYLPEAEKKQLLIDDLLEYDQLSFCKHANGKDWWIIAPQVLTKETYLLRLYENGEIENQGTMYFSEHNGRVRSSAATVFNPQGNQFARLIVRSDTSFMHIFEVFNFDRCTGKVEHFFTDSLFLTEQYTSGGDIEYSANGRFLYMAIGSIVLQMDMEDNHFFENRDTIAEWDGFLYYSLPPLFDGLWRLPNDKILVGSLVSTPYLHYIHAPNELGLACDFEQRALVFPIDPLNDPFRVDIDGFPSFPPYRMAALEQKCISNIPEEKQAFSSIGIFPNPVLNKISLTNIQDLSLRISSILGKTLAVFPTYNHSIGGLDMTTYHKGIYFFTFYDKQGRIVCTKKVIKW